MPRLFDTPPPDLDGPLVVSVGGGVNSTAMLVGLRDRGVRPDLCLFADTGGEWPETYAHVAELSRWCEAQGFPAVTRVSGATPARPSLEADCLRLGTLPSAAFGFAGCSFKWKRYPMDRFVRDWPPARDCWAAGRKVWRAIGYDADESHRGKIPEDDRHRYWYPLADWDWGRQECVAAIRRAGLPVPRKSACFFCPAAEPEEIIELGVRRPDLAARAAAIEAAAAPNLMSVRGLGRDFAWADLLAGRITAAEARSAPKHTPCDCYDGTPGLFDEPEDIPR